MNNNIEQLKTEVNNIKNSLNKLKKNFDNSQEKKAEAEELKRKAEETKKKVEAEMETLSKGKGAEVEEEKRKTKELLDSFKEITDLYNSIMNKGESAPEQSAQQAQPETESKNIFGKVRDWIWDQRDNVWDEEKWKTEGGKNLLRTAGFMATGVGAVSLAYKGIKKLFGRGKNEDEDDKEDDKEDKKEDNEEEKKDKEPKKKSFWDTGLGKTLAWLGIGSATGGGIYFLGKKFNRWNNSDDKSTDNTQTQSQESSETQSDNTQPKIDDSKVDTKGFTPGDYPFKHITHPYKGVETYRVDNLKFKPLLGFADLARSGTEGEMTTLKVRNLTPKFSEETAGYKKNNPCNVSPFKGDVGHTGSSKVADGQNHAQYASMVDGLASFMRLMRQDRYRNKSIQGMNCSGMQGIYKSNEPDSLKALRIIWITNASKALKVNPFARLNTDDKETMMAYAQQTAINESGSYFDRKTLERAYNIAFPKG